MQEARVINEHLKDSIPEYYSNNPLVRWLFKKRLTAAASLVARTGCKTLVDLGCGDGSFVRHVLKSGLPLDELQAVDIHPHVLNLNEELKGCLFSCQNIDRTDFADGEFEGVTCLDVLEHFEDLSAPIREIRRILAAGGHLITSEPTETGLYKLLRFAQKGHFSKRDARSIDYHFHNAASVETALGNGGFAAITRKILPLPFPADLFHIILFRKEW
jgi:2-polyprenyl-3-methyl-5-hydroxy-6-metoxy-1,4-benzoquinol methylase